MIELSAVSQRWKAWLTSAHVIRADGAVMSWHNPAHPGYAYPEIAGLMLSFLGRYVADDDELVARIVARIGSELGPSGGVRRASVEYAFDSAMVLGGLLATHGPGDSARSELETRIYAFITDLLRERTGIVGDGGDPDRWSNAYGCHLLKTSLAISAYADGRDDAEQQRAWSLLEQLVADLAPLQEQGRFRIHARSASTYLHAHCYATEGLLCLRARGMRGLDSAIEESASWLASIQTDAGAMRAWHDGREASGTAHTDATAQAARIWALVDRDRFAREIELAHEFLQSQTHPVGGLRYEPGSADANTWATIFASQAARWAEHPGSALEII